MINEFLYIDYCTDYLVDYIEIHVSLWWIYDDHESPQDEIILRKKEIERTNIQSKAYKTTKSGITS